MDIYGYEGAINRPPTAANGLLITLLANWNNVANILQNIHVQPRISQRTLTKTPNLHSARRRGRFIVPVSLHNQICIFISPHTHFCSPFCGCIRICGRDKSAPTAANGLLITLLANWNNVANILQNIHVQPRISQRTLTKTPNLHSARRRGRFIVPVSLHCQIRIFPLLNTYIHFIANGCPHLKIRIFKSPHTHFCSPFCGCLRVCGRDKSAPTAANGLLITLLANWNNVANILQNIHVQPRISQRTLTKTPNLHSARRRGRFIVPVSLHYQIHIFTSSHTYVQITTPALSQ